MDWWKSVAGRIEQARLEGYQQAIAQAVDWLRNHARVPNTNVNPGFAEVYRFQQILSGVAAELESLQPAGNGGESLADRDEGIRQECIKAEPEPEATSLIDSDGLPTEGAVLRRWFIEERQRAEKLRNLLEWALDWIADGEPQPDHECDYSFDPEAGLCVFCDKYGEARAAIEEYDAGKEGK